jgi:hypothetical protein
VAINRGGGKFKPFSHPLRKSPTQRRLMCLPRKREKWLAIFCWLARDIVLCRHTRLSHPAALNFVLFLISDKSNWLWLYSMHLYLSSSYLLRPAWRKVGQWIWNCSNRILGIFPVNCMQRIVVTFPFSNQRLSDTRIIYCKCLDFERRHLHCWPQSTTQLRPRVAVGGFLPE